VQSYYTKWGAYPFAMTFASPPASNTAYHGASGQTKGLLPVTDDPNWFKWGSATVTQIPGGTGSSTVTGWNCSVNPSPLQAVCRVDYSGGSSDRPDVNVRVFLQNANTSFADIPSPFTTPENLTMVDHNGNPLGYSGAGYGQWSAVGSLLPTESFATQTPVVTQTGVLTYTGRLQNAYDTGNRVFITIPLPTPAYLPIVSGDSTTVNPTGWWFIANQWYRQTYYAVSAGYVSGGDPSTCTSPTKTSCLTVKYVPAPTDDKRVVIVLAGQQLNGTSRPSSGNVADYFENANLTAANGSVPFIYENHAGAPTTINDRVVVVSP
jgi:hypothetical protein